MRVRERHVSSEIVGFYWKSSEFSTSLWSIEGKPCEQTVFRKQFIDFDCVCLQANYQTIL